MFIFLQKINDYQSRLINFSNFLLKLLNIYLKLKNFKDDYVETFF